MSCRVSDLSRAQRLARGLHRFKRGMLTLADLDTETTVIDELGGFFSFHRPPVVILGSGNSTAAHKFAATLLALFHEVGPHLGCRTFKTYVDEFRVPTTDFGDEYRLSAIVPVLVLSVFPWLMPPAPEMQGMRDDEDYVG